MLLICSIMNGQNKKTKRAKRDFKSHAYAETIDRYKQLVKEGFESEEIYKKFGRFLLPKSRL